MATENDDWLYSDEADSVDFKEYDSRLKKMERIVEAA